MVAVIALTFNSLSLLDPVLNTRCVIFKQYFMTIDDDYIYWKKRTIDDDYIYWGKKLELMMTKYIGEKCNFLLIYISRPMI